MLVKPTISFNFEKPREPEPYFGKHEILGNVGNTNVFHCRPPPSGTHVLVFMLLRKKADLGT